MGNNCCAYSETENKFLSIQKNSNKLLSQTKPMFFKSKQVIDEFIEYGSLSKEKLECTNQNRKNNLLDTLIQTVIRRKIIDKMSLNFIREVIFLQFSYKIRKTTKLKTIKESNEEISVDFNIDLEQSENRKTELIENANFDNNSLNGNSNSQKDEKDEKENKDEKDEKDENHKESDKKSTNINSDNNLNDINDDFININNRSTVNSNIFKYNLHYYSDFNSILAYFISKSEIKNLIEDMVINEIYFTSDKKNIENELKFCKNTVDNNISRINALNKYNNDHFIFNDVNKDKEQNKCKVDHITNETNHNLFIENNTPDICEFEETMKIAFPSNIDTIDYQNFELFSTASAQAVFLFELFPYSSESEKSLLILELFSIFDIKLQIKSFKLFLFIYFRHHILNKTVALLRYLSTRIGKEVFDETVDNSVLIEGADFVKHYISKEKSIINHYYSNFLSSSRDFLIKKGYSMKNDEDLLSVKLNILIIDEFQKSNNAIWDILSLPEFLFKKHLNNEGLAGSFCF